MKIFVSYRREDSSAWAGRLRDSLAARFGEGNIFQDVAAVRPGEEFPDAISAALARSDAALAVIGPNWLSVVSTDGQPRLAATDDYVRFELIAALSQRKLVIPVLVGGAAMPSATQLSEELKPLALLQAVSLRDETWHSDVEGLIHALRGDQPQARPRRRTAALVLAGVLVAAGVAAVALLVGGGDGDGDNELSATTLAQSPPTSFDPFSQKPDCPPPTPSDWTDLGVTGTDEIGLDESPIGRVDVLDGQYRTDGDGWQVALDLRYVNFANTSQYHYWWLYTLALEGVRSQPYCFTRTAGQDPITPGASGDALVGFNVTVDPTNGAAALNVNYDGDVGRVVLVAT